MQRVALVSGGWGQNIGNAFFNVGGKYLLEQVFGCGNVHFIQDQSAYRTFHDQSRGNPHNDLNLLRYVDVDVVVLQGPMLTVNFGNIWGDAFREYRTRGVKVILLGAGLFSFTGQEIRAAREVLEEYPPLIISTRDNITYEAIRGCVPHTYNGIDSAFFVPDAFSPLPLTIDPYIVFNFDRFPEPTVTEGATAEADGKIWRIVEWDKYQWTLTTPQTQQWFSSRGKWQAYIGHLLDCRKLPKELAGHAIVRPEHRTNPFIAWKVYKHPNTVAWDEPFTYFTIYGNSKLTLADRVHACVMTLAYGNPAMLFTPSPRAQLFDRLDLAAIRERPVSLCSQRLDEEKQSESEWLCRAVANTFD